MQRMLRFLNLLFLPFLGGMLVFAACGQPIPTGYDTYTLPDKGIAHLSFEYPAAFYVKQVQLFDDTGFERMDIEGPYSRKYRDRTTMWVVAQRSPSNTTVSELVQNSANTASGLPGYRLIERSPININGIAAEQHIYFYFTTRSDYEKKVLGFAPASMVTREVFFALNDLQWTVGMSADENTVKTDTIGFEHLLQTLTMLP
jgi:hypothetical protein